VGPAGPGISIGRAQTLPSGSLPRRGKTPSAWSHKKTLLGVRVGPAGPGISSGGPTKNALPSGIAPKTRIVHNLSLIKLMPPKHPRESWSALVGLCSVKIKPFQVRKKLLDLNFALCCRLLPCRGRGFGSGRFLFPGSQTSSDSHENQNQHE